ncbi:transposase [Candidatus Nitrosotenuis chungbukensis]|uniref:RNA-guided endonuclease InsQ/TnpB family protein n=1 Tax=Candidatus Nitrosotenuis chungbukensis TaxID=1353246 RepID=UPI0005B27D29|nr:RNA-guided endonuclease TnpB family protein [Candidatus Nitrosotenuis chungbukensis]WKT57535.1 transposase [Candidatus Nitrosotenuis chungbukensis]
MEEFRWMINEAIRIGIERNITSQQAFNSNVYHYLSDNTEFLKLYVARAMQIARSKINHLRKTRRKNPNAKIPHYKKPHVIVDKQSYRIIGNTLLIGVRPGQSYVGIPLNNYTVSQISDPCTKIGAITITQDTISISILKETPSIKFVEFIGIDTNLNNISAVHSDGTTNVYSDIVKITKIKERYRKVTSHFKRNDTRIRRKIFQKYGTKQKCKTQQIIHNITKKLVEQKKQIILEDLTGIRKLYQKGNGQGTKYRSRLNGWPFYEFRKQLEYKSKWYNGIDVIKIKPNHTSSKCSICGAKVIPEENRQIRCHCGHREDRDINAARNILYKGIPAVQLRGMGFRPNASQDEAMKQSKDVKQIVMSQINQL